MAKYRVDLVYNKKKLYTSQEIQDHLDDPGNVKWERAGDLLGKLYGSCVDGREDGHIVGNPGGDIAILAEAVIANARIVGRELTLIELGRAFSWYLEVVGSVYMHTDHHALEHLGKSLQGDLRIGKKFSDAHAVLRYVQNPEPKQQLRLLDHLLEPNNIGCGHLKLMLQDPAAYGMSRKVLQGLMGAFFDVMWNGTEAQKKDLVYRILEGDHNEGAVVEICVAGSVDDDTLIPMVRPNGKEVSMFVVHPQVCEYMHRKVAKALASSDLFPGISAEQAEKIYETMQQMLSTEVRETVSRLALILPHYRFELKLE